MIFKKEWKIHTQENSNNPLTMPESWANCVEQGTTHPKLLLFIFSFIKRLRCWALEPWAEAIRGNFFYERKTIKRKFKGQFQTLKETVHWEPMYYADMDINSGSRKLGVPSWICTNQLWPWLLLTLGEWLTFLLYQWVKMPTTKLMWSLDQIMGMKKLHTH